MDRNRRPERFAACLIALALVACFEPRDPEPPPQPPPDEPNPPVQPGSCEAACAHLRELGCREGGKTKGRDGVPDTGDETTCEAICETGEREGHSVNPGCLERVSSCQAIASC